MGSSVTGKTQGDQDKVVTSLFLIGGYRERTEAIGQRALWVQGEEGMGEGPVSPRGPGQ